MFISLPSTILSTLWGLQFEQTLTIVKSFFSYFLFQIALLWFLPDAVENMKEYFALKQNKAAQ